MTFTLINEMKTIINGRKAFEVARACVEIPLNRCKEASMTIEKRISARKQGHASANRLRKIFISFRACGVHATGS
ncbi:hypothetical protein [Brucella melitensis]|uniref:hypothetical protein n=1 Tax=Brucella melitensis TaxID=29459 RepID=UPI0013966BE8|nr:hypothetical protein [Brucella melitensis]